jgi:IS30 family transposase
MNRRRKHFYTEAERSMIWDRWQKGETLGSIARFFDRHHPSIEGIIARTGGIRPAPRCRSSRSLTLAEREEISRGIAIGQSLRSIAGKLNRSPSTISREINRNGGLEKYRASDAEKAAWERAYRPKICKLITHRPLSRIVAQKLQLEWSPQQIAGWLKRTFPDDETRQVSHETIYRTLYIQARGALKKELIKHLRKPRVMRRSRHHTQKTPDHGQIVDAVSISERPPIVEDRAVPGHWEGDLLIGTLKSQIATLVERSSRYTMLIKLPNREAETVTQALIKHSQKLPDQLYKSLTWDRGKELASHKKFTVATDIKVYFCDPSSPWQRGSNENTNGLLRQYFPKGMDLSKISQAQLNAVAKKLNGRPRKTLNYLTPAEKFDEYVASTN